MHHLRPGSSRRDPVRGFSLVELLITLAILGILVSIALPSYSRYVARARRAQARVQLVQASQFMVRFYAANDSFKADRAGNAAAAKPAAVAT